jgi:hypothetical protein
MNDHRRQILEMLSAGKITAEEAERLIAAVEREPAASVAAENAASPSSKFKYLRVLVDSDSGGNPYHGPVKANVRVPLKLLRAGVRLAGLIPPQAREHVNHAMRERGIPFDLSQIKPDNLQELVDHFNDLTIDVAVDNKGAFGSEKVTVRLFCE